MIFKWRRRCFRCLHYLRDDGTCQNPKCVRYTKEDTDTETSTTTDSGTVATSGTSDTAAAATEAGK